jgi:uncharacterized protein (DUF1697 family)
MTRIALLRGINVGGHRKVPMADLRAALTAVGLHDLSTYIQSGNVIFGGGPSDRDDVAALVSRVVEERFGFEIPVIVREATDLAVLLDRSTVLFPPADDDAGHVKRVHVGFLSATPTEHAIAAIDPGRAPGDAAVVEGEHVHMAYAIGPGSSKLTGDYIERTLGVAVTMRNLATVRKLIDLTT